MDITFTLELYVKVKREESMDARSAKGAETRLRIIQAAADLFHK